MKNVAILFPDPHLPYSPTVINLAEALTRHFEVTIVAFHHKHFGKLQKPFVRYIPLPWLLMKVYGAINKVSLPMGLKALAFIMKLVSQKHFRKQYYDHVIAVDPLSIWLVKGVEIPKLHLLSLELTNNTTAYLPKINLHSIASIITQTKERLAVLSNDFGGKVFFIQNAPTFNQSMIKQIVPPENELIFSGTGTAKFGLFSCLDFLNAYPQFRLTIQGKVLPADMAVIEKNYQHLLGNNRLILEKVYLDTPALIKKVGQYRIGICLYDFSFPEIDNVNYYTAPSGKMFLYFAAGVPCVAINIPGLYPVKNFNAGCLIDELKPANILSAINEIESDYQAQVNGCYKAARHFCFEASVQPFINFLLN